MDKKNKSGISTILNEFKQFISKGNVIDLAVGVIVGGAFTSIVSSLVDDMLMPIIGMILAGINFKDFGITIPWGNEPFINIGNFIQAIITFLLTAICVFAIVKIINLFYKKLKNLRPSLQRKKNCLLKYVIYLKHKMALQLNQLPLLTQINQNKIIHKEQLILLFYV